MKHRALNGAVSATLALTLWWAGAARGQPAPASQPAPTTFPSVNFADPAFGFELNLPAGWDYDRTRFQQFKDSIGLLRGRAPGGRRGLQIVVFRSFDMQPFEDWIVEFGKAAAELMNSPRVDWETWRLPPRVGAILSGSAKLGAVSTRSHYLCVPFDPSTVWVLVYSGSMVDEAEQPQIRREFDQIAATLRILYDPEQIERLAPAFERGKALLEKLRAQAPKARLDEDEYTYEIAIAGKPVGYLTRRVSREEYVFSGPTAKRRYAKDGLRVRERSWRFSEDGTVRYARLDLFSSFDFQSEMMESQQTQTPPPNVQPQEPLVRTDQVVRESDVLFSSYRTSRDRDLPDPGKPMGVGPVYLDQAWVRLLPGLLLGELQEPYAVAIYNFETRALLTHLLQSLGERKLAGYDRPAYAFEVREGFVDHPSLLYADEHGTLLRLEAGEVTITRIPRADAERQYGPRRDEARHRCGIPED